MIQFPRDGRYENDWDAEERKKGGKYERWGIYYFLFWLIVPVTLAIILV
jgi:hypothetical protein